MSGVAQMLAALRSQGITLRSQHDLGASSGFTFGGVVPLSAGQFLIVYSNAVIEARVLTVATGGGITAGSAYAVAASGAGAPSVAMLSATKAIVCYNTPTVSYMACRVLDISGTVVSVGAEYIFEAAGVSGAQTIVGVSASRAFGIAHPSLGGTLRSRVIDVAGSTISFGNLVAMGVNEYNDVCVALTATKILMCSRDVSSNLIGQIATISGTNHSYGTRYTLAAPSHSPRSVVRMTDTTALFATVAGSNLQAAVVTESGGAVSIGSLTTILASTGGGKLALLNARRAVALTVQSSAANLVSMSIEGGAVAKIASVSVPGTISAVLGAERMSDAEVILGYSNSSPQLRGATAVIS